MAKFTVEGTVLGIVMKSVKRKDGTEFEQAKVDLYQAGEKEPVVQVTMSPEELPEVGQVIQVPIRLRTWAQGNARVTLDINAIKQGA